MLPVVELAMTKNLEASKLGSKAYAPTPTLKVLYVVSGLVTNACTVPLAASVPGRTNKSWAFSNAAGKARPKAQSANTLLSMPVKTSPGFGRGGEFSNRLPQ